MGWLSSLFFSPLKNSRRGQALHSTHDAFSIPTSSPTSRHPDAFNPELLSSPGPDSLISPSYSYPPQGCSYGYIPSSNGRSSGAPLLPMHQGTTTMSGPSGYPPLAHTWKRLRDWLNREYPELGDTLNYGILPEDLANIEMEFGFPLPPAVRESYLTVDGQEAESFAGCSEGLFFGFSLLPLDLVLEEWKLWREVDDDPMTGANPCLRESMRSIPPNWVCHEYSQRGWIPLVTDKAGNYIGVDVNPGENGTSGQVIVFGREFDTKVVLWRGDGYGGWGKWLASFVEELETGETYEMGNGNESEGSEDGVGYESYYHDGTGGGQGDGGGDSSARVGLKLTGQYRGWNAMEAWADRSIHKWLEIGVISEADLHGKGSQASISNLTDPSSKKAMEVTIPVLTDVEISEPVASSSQKSRPEIPTISVTKPPAPRPVALPTPKDIQPLPSPPDSIQTRYADDVESSLPHSHPDRRNNLSRLPTPPPSADDVRTFPPTTIPLPASPVEEKLVELGGPETEDLLSHVDSVSSQTPTPMPPPISTFTQFTSNNSAVLTAPVSNPLDSPTILSTPAAVDEDTTVRLVGGGGTSGISADANLDIRDDENPQQQVTDTDDAASISSVNSSSSAATKMHKKTKSGLASLKKLGHDQRKRDGRQS